MIKIAAYLMGALLSTGGLSLAQANCLPFKAAQMELLKEVQGFGRDSILESDLARYIPYRVKNLNDSGPGSLREALASTEPRWITFDVDGTIKLDPENPIKIKSQKVVDGRGRDIVVHGGFKIQSGTRNVVITDITISLADHYPNGKVSTDLIGIWGEGASKVEDYTTQNIWMNHLDLSRGNDGAIDIRGGTNITISSCSIHDHEKAILVSLGSNKIPTPETRVTMYHNHFNSVTRRQPQMHFGKLDYFNNVVDNWWEFGIGVFEGAEAIIENNYFSPKGHCLPLGCTNPNSPTGDRLYWASRLAVVYEWNNYPHGSARVLGSVYSSEVQARSQNQGQVFRREEFYDLKPDKMDAKLAQKIRKEAGPRGKKRYCIEPQII